MIRSTGTETKASNLYHLEENISNIFKIDPDSLYESYYGMVTQIRAINSLFNSLLLLFSTSQFLLFNVYSELTCFSVLPRKE